MSSGTPTQSITDTLDDLVGIYGQLYDGWSRAATRILELFERQGRQVGGMLPALQGFARPPASRCCSCEIPPACWLPRELGERTSHVCPGQTATICLRVVNCGATARTVTVHTGTDGKGVSITNSPLALGPMEEGAVVVSYKADAGSAQGESRRILIWARGCREHLLRWTVTSGRDASGTCHHVEIEDCPDSVHHWYDHFYCAHSCACQDG